MASEHIRVILERCTECDQERVCAEFGVSLIPFEGNCEAATVCADCIKRVLSAIEEREL